MQGGAYPPFRDDLPFSNTTGILQKKKTMWFIGVEVEQETSTPPPKKYPGSAPALFHESKTYVSEHLCMRDISAFRCNFMTGLQDLEMHRKTKPHP